MRPIHAFTISPSLPSRLSRLRELAYNLWWAWHMEAIDLFRRLDRDLWETTGHNPVLLLGTIEQEKLERAARDEAFLAHLVGHPADLHRRARRLLGRGWTDSTLHQHSTNTPQAGYGGDPSLYGRSAEKPLFPRVSGIVAVAGDSG